MTWSNRDIGVDACSTFENDGGITSDMTCDFQMGWATDSVLDADAVFANSESTVLEADIVGARKASFSDDCVDEAIGDAAETGS